MNIVFISNFEDYLQIMSPLSGALYIFQSEEKPYLGNLWPTITVLLKRMNELQFQQWKFCGILLGANLDGIQTRFSGDMKDVRLILASPNF